MNPPLKWAWDVDDVEVIDDSTKLQGEDYAGATDDDEE